MQYDHNNIDRVIELNKTLPDTRKVTSVYGALIQDSKGSLGWENFRDHRTMSGGKENNIQYIDNMAEFIHHFQENGIVFQYCLNATKEMTAETLFGMRKKIFWFCDSLLRNKITHLKISNLLLFDFIHEYYQGAFTYYMSTTKEYSSIMQYDRIFNSYPDLREVCLPTDLNRDFLFLENFLRKFPDTVPEIMVNEGCIYACPWRKDHTPHSSETHMGWIRKFLKEGKTNMPGELVYYYGNQCSKCRKPLSNQVEEYFLRRSILPWWIPTYEELGIRKLKFAGRDMNISYLLDSLENYIKGIDDYSSIESLPWNYFNNYNKEEIGSINMTIKDLIEFYPDIKFFYSSGGSCHANCGESCNYCRKQAAKFVEYSRLNGGSINETNRNL